MQLSIIIPTLNEAQAIGPTLDALARLTIASQILIVDGGSQDATEAIANTRGVPVIRTSACRGLQMHAGACGTQGEVLWFLHADSLVPPQAAERILQALHNRHIAGGNFSLQFDGETRSARLLTRLYPHFRKLGLCYGDSGIFCRRSVYEAAGGFRPFPIFEDLDLVQRLKQRGRFVHLSCPITTSSRRFEGHSFARTFARWTGMQILYWVGIPPHALARVYHPIREVHPPRIRLKERKPRHYTQDMNEFSPPSGLRFRLKTSLRAIKLHEDADRTIDNQGFLVQIPSGEIVETDGGKRISGMRNVIWKGEFYALFESDLLNNSEPVG